ncbi:protein kinase domain-containing protein [Actinomadura scrupuli]|uniref:serine/threonine-protein kinase n=1 Tax=Actinomadura scrupuli TaxID=559629 RepID=UPI003D96DD24
MDGFSEIGELGSGAQGRVVLARRGESGPFVAIKYVFDTGQGDTRIPSQREAQILSSVDNRHVARLHGLVEGPSGVAIVMEAVEGVSLDKLLREYGALEPEAALLVLKGSLLGLGAAHAVGVVHRDYKPANVIVQADGVSKLIDFGIATPSGERSLTGTPAYMAPEQWSGEPATPATDVYAATCVFFECVTGHPPYAGDNQMALMVQHTTAAPPVVQVPEPLRMLVAHGMAKEAVQRPPGAAEFLVELEAAAVEAYGEDWERRGLILLGAGAAALAALFPQAAATGAAGTTIAGSTLGESVMGTVGTVSREAVRLGRPRLLATAAVAAVAVVAIAAVALVLTKQSRPIALTRPGASASPSVPTPAPTATASPADSPTPAVTPTATPAVTPTEPSPSPSQPAPSPSDVVPAGNPTTGPPATNGTTPPVVQACPRLTPPAGSFGSLQVKQTATESFSFPWNPCYSAAGITLRGDPAFSRQLTACPPASGTGTCRIQVTFAPTSSGTHQATLVIPDKTGADAVTIDLTGVAESTDCFPYTSARDIGEVPVNTTKQMSFTYPWRSCDAVEQMRVVDESGQFTAALSDCPPPAGTDQCSFTVSFTPSDAGPQSATMLIPSDTGGQAVRITLTGTGTGTGENTEVATSATPEPAVTKPVLGVSEPPSSDPQPSTGPSTSGPVPQPSKPKPVPSTSKPDPEPAGSKPDPEPPTSKPDPEVSTPPGSEADVAPQSKASPTAP